MKFVPLQIVIPHVYKPTPIVSLHPDKPTVDFIPLYIYLSPLNGEGI